MHDGALRIELANEKLSLLFNVEAGGIERLVVKGLGTEMNLNAPECEVQPIFRLNWDAPTQQPPKKATLLRNVAEDVTLRLIDHKPTGTSDGAQGLEALYEVDDKGLLATVRLSIRLIALSDEVLVSAEVHNISPTATISEVILPILGNIRVNEDAACESLLYPFFSGVLLEQPRISIPKGRAYPEAATPLTPTYGTEGGMVRHLYCGRLSMPWMTLFTDVGGVGLIHYDTTYEVSALTIYAPTSPSNATNTTRSPVLDLAVSKVRPIGPAEIRTIPATGVIAYTGSWHQVADRYRAWSKAQRFLPPRVPEWVRESHALTAHYDFKWEDGTFNHTFGDIPKLYHRTAAEGITHIFMAGWFTGGFDHMYPEFFPDLQLGTVMDFIDNVRTVRDEGGRATFYINASLFGRASRYFDSLGASWAVKNPEGKYIDRRFFGRDFTVSCRGAQDYQRHMRDSVRWLVGEVGASGVYLDTFAAIGPHLCFDPSHGHPHPAHWNRDSIATLRMVEDTARQYNHEAFTMFEGCGDVYGQWIVAHLIHGWAYPHSYPAMFRYTFPEYVLVDMVYPSKGQSFRPARISQEAYDQLHRTFIHGCILWVYDQEDERFCNFRTDPEMWAYIKALLALREQVKRYFGYGHFVDTVGLQFDSAQLDVKRFVAVHETEKFDPADIEMLAVWNRSGAPAVITLDPSLVDSWGSDVTGLQVTGLGVNGKRAVAYQVSDDGLRLTLPGDRITIVCLERGNST